MHGWTTTWTTRSPRPARGCARCAGNATSPSTSCRPQTGISKSTLSRLESGSRRPTLELLLPLARVYGVTLDELVGAPPTGDPRVHLRPVTRNGMTMLPLTRRAGGIQAFKIIMSPGGRPGEPEPRTHEGYEWIYVLNGRLRLVLGDHDLVLTPGEAAEFDTRTPALVRPGRGERGRVPQPVRQAGRARAPARAAEGLRHGAARSSARWGSAFHGDVPRLIAWGRSTPVGASARGNTRRRVRPPRPRLRTTR